jgi:hypothetical protein
MAQPNHTPRLAYTEEALTVLFCLIDDAYAHLNPRARHYESIKRLADSEVIALALFQQLRGVESERSFLRDTERFFAHLFPGVVGLHPSSFHRRMRKLRRLEWSLCAARSSPRWLGIQRRCSSTRLCFQFCTPCSGLSGLGFPRRRMGTLGELQRLRGEAAPALFDQPGSYLLRTHRCQHRGHVPHRGTHQRGGFGRGGSEEALGRPSLP